MKVELTRRAQREAREARTYWRKNRDKNPGLLTQELRAARKLLSRQPHAGTNYAIVDGVQILRLNTGKTRRHLYYHVDEPNQTVWIISVWGAQKGEAPDLSLDDDIESGSTP